MSLSDCHSLESLADWMRKNGVRRARTGDLEVEFFELAVAAATSDPPRELTEDERERAAFQKRKSRYERELGRKLSDDEVRRLP